MHATREDLVCPVSRSPLSLTRCDDWVHRQSAQALGSGPFTPIGLTEHMMVRADQRVAYPVVDGTPVLLATEAFGLRDAGVGGSVEDPIYAEAYQEMALYGAKAAAQSEALSTNAALAFLRRVAADPLREADRFPEPRSVWFTGIPTIAAQHRCYSFLAPVKDQTVLQLGGSGLHAVLLLLAGARRAVVVSPVLEELHLAILMAREVGVAESLTAVGGVAERLPVADGAIDRVYSGSSIHHTVTSQSFGELRRVLRPGGRAASVDVWKAPLHGVGTRVFGKRGGNRFCRPLDPNRLKPLYAAFPDADVAFHGALARYPLVLLVRAGVFPTPRLAWTLAAAEDRLARRSAWMRRQSSLVSLCLTRGT